MTDDYPPGATQVSGAREYPPAPINVKLSIPNDPPWPLELRREWQLLNLEAGGNPNFYPLTVKFIYTLGIIHDICLSVSCLLSVHRIHWSATYLPAYSVFASAIDILGRCIRGNSTTRENTADIKAGLKWLAQLPPNADDRYELIHTSSRAYSIQDLTTLRHYTAHGQATTNSGDSSQFREFDGNILEQLSPLLVSGLQRYWELLATDEGACNKLGEANILAVRSSPMSRMLQSFSQLDEHGANATIPSIFSRFDWR